MTTTLRENSGTVDLVDKREYSLSVIMPAHNEERTIERAIAEVLEVDFGHRLELIVVDDGSSDRTPHLLAGIDDQRVVAHRHRTNLGKGAAVLTGAALATGSHLVVFDADHEYRAADLAAMFEAIVEGRADVVFGTRMFGMNTVYQSYRYAMGNRMTTLVANVIFDACLTDLHTCLKMLPLPLFRELRLTHSGFGLDSEITAELLRRGHRPFEVPVSYVSRTHAQGKQLTWRDGVDCLKVLGLVRLRGRCTVQTVPATPALELLARDRPPTRSTIAADLPSHTPRALRQAT
jgi:hypothetical protein